jgi:hypothetical protein
LNNEKGSLKISCTWTNIGALGSVKGGLKLGGGCSSTTSTSTKLASSNHKYDPSESLSWIWHRFGGGSTSVIGSSPRNRWDWHGSSAMVKILCN